jgi:nucleoside-diphosphate-sugar epimerase
MSFYCVTGGAGFIGSHLVEELLRRGERVRIADDFSTGRRENVDAAVAAAVEHRRASGLETVSPPDVLEGDLADLDCARAAVAGADFVLHQAAIPSVPRSVADPVTSNRANVDATLTVLVAARDAGVKRLVFAGSSSEYGDAPTLPKHEEMPLDPLSPYALQKVIGEQYLKQFTRLYGLETVSIRYFNVFGPRQDPGSPYSGVISLFVKWLFEGTRPTVYGDGEQTRDFTYVANVVDGVLRACEAPGVSGEAINVATAGRISLNELLRVLQTIVGTNLAPIYGPPRVGDVRDSQASIGKARRLLGYTPSVSFEEGLRHTVEWFKESQGSGGEARTPTAARPG